MVAFGCSYCLIYGEKERYFYSNRILHFLHTFFGSLSALFYLISYDFYFDVMNSGYVITLILFSVAIPCILSDVAIPLLFKKFHSNSINVYNYEEKEKNKN